MYTNFLTTTIISLFCFWEKVFTLINTWEDREKFSETSLSEKVDFYNHLNIENITDTDYAHAKRVCKDFETKHLGEYNYFYVQNNTILLADVFENF